MVESHARFPVPRKRCCDFHHFSGVLAALRTVIYMVHLGSLWWTAAVSSSWSAGFAWGWRRQCWQAKQEQNLVVAQIISKLDAQALNRFKFWLTLSWYELLKYFAVVDLMILTWSWLAARIFIWAYKAMIMYDYVWLCMIMLWLCNCNWNCLIYSMSMSNVNNHL